MAAQNGIAPAVQFARFPGFVVRGGNKRQAAPPRLLQARFHKRNKIRRIVDFAVLPGRLQSAGVGKTAGRKSRVGQLPNEKIIVRAGELNAAKSQNSTVK